MITKLKFGIVAGVLALTVGAGVAFAAMSADDAIKARKACMKDGHGLVVFKTAVPMVKGDKPFDAAELKAAFETEDKVCADWSKWWSADLLKGDKEQTHAKPEIGTDAKGFEAASAAWYQADQKLRTVTDLAGLKASIKAVGDGCSGCHDKFRTSMQ